jgi:hypothetical protein
MSGLDRSTPPPPAPVREFIFPDVLRDTLPNGVQLLTVQQGYMRARSTTPSQRAGWRI